MSLLVMAAGVSASNIAFNIRRDREEELIHRGVQYTRAIREFSRKTGRFPMSLEDLDNVNGRRFLRKHYKDPITGQDFKLVYMSQVVQGSVLPALPTPPYNGAPGFKSANWSVRANSDSTATQSSSSPESDINQSTQVQADSAVASTTDSKSNGTSSNSDQPLQGGGMIVGVVSGSKNRTIREFSGKNRYDQWRFYYDPAFDKFALSNAPTIKTFFPPAQKLAGSVSPAEMNNPQSPLPGDGQYQ